MSELSINGVKVSSLKEKYGTPLYVYDENMIINHMQKFNDAFKSSMFATKVVFASKSFNTKEMLRIAAREGLGLDCVSMGELYTAFSVSFPNKDIYMHGNNKSIEELEACIIGNIHIVVDNVDELELLISLAKTKEVNVYVRLNVGVDAHTHKYIVTSHIDSKFGVIYQSVDYNKMLDLIAANSNIKLEGFHAHIGSQIFDISAFEAEIDKLVEACKGFDYPLSLDLGGGFGVKYTESDSPVPFDVVAKTLIGYVENSIKKNKVTLNKVIIEPGRSIVAEAGYTLYTIGFIKQTPNRIYYFVDGGMTDNIRPALYQAKYACDVATKMNEVKNKMVCIAGKCCESGDIIIENCMLPQASSGDLLIIYSTGAYGYAMSSNYNKALTPAVVFIKDGKDRLVVRRQTYEDLILREL